MSVERVRPARLVLVAALAAAWGCSQDAVPPDQGPRPPRDAGTPGTLRRADGETGAELRVVAGATTEVPVELRSGEGEPLAGEQVRFQLEGDTKGATLRAPAVDTDEAGVARAELNPGAAPAFFRLRAEASNAPPLVLNVTVSNAGFASVAVDLVPGSQGAGATPSPGAFAGVRSVQVRLYHLQRCSTVSAAMPPQPVRPADEVNDTSAEPELTYVLALDDPPEATVYSILATATDLYGELVASGCVTLTGRELARMPPGRGEIDVILPLRPVLYAVAGTYRVSTAFRIDPDTPTLVAALEPFEALATCPATRMLDCVLDAASDEDPADCEPGPEDELAISAKLAGAIARARAAAGGEHRCRSSSRARDGGESLDLTVADLLEAGSPTLGSRLAAVLQAARGALGSFGLQSRLVIYPPTDDGVALFDHLGDRIDLSASGVGRSYPAVTFGEMIARSAAARYVAPLMLALGSHSFQLDYRKLALVGVNELALSANGAANAADLADQILGVLEVPDSAQPSGLPHVGCAALAALVCTRVGEEDDCEATVLALCERTPEMLERAVALSLEVLGTQPSTLTLSGDAIFVDQDGNLATDGLSSGTWSALLSTPEKTLEASGPFTAVLAP